MGFFRPSVEFAVRVEGEQSRVEGECVLRAEDDIFCNTSIVFRVFFL